MYTADELLREHEYAEPHIVAGVRMHGGFLADGTYQPPRALVREPALDAWTEALRGRGGDLLDADASLLVGARMPNVAGRDVIERFWHGLVHWATVEQPRLAATEQRLLIDARIARHGDATTVLSEFDRAG